MAFHALAALVSEAKTSSVVNPHTGHATRSMNVRTPSCSAQRKTASVDLHLGQRLRGGCSDVMGRFLDYNACSCCHGAERMINLPAPPLPPHSNIHSTSGPHRLSFRLNIQ